MNHRQRLLRLAVVFGAGAGAFCQVTCPGDWAGRTLVIPPEKINDGYCDCPLTGADEPNTAACSGSMGWVGVASPKDNDDDSSKPGPVLLTCPQQPKLKLPQSRVNDGICDCCDGADELETGVCTDNCEVVLAEERRLRKELLEKFEKGSKIRQQAIEDFATLRAEKLKEAEQMEGQLSEVDASLTQVVEKYDQLEIVWISKRLDAVKSRLLSVGLTSGAEDVPDLPEQEQLKGMLEPLSEEELTWWIIHACQLAGEMLEEGNSKASSKTCVPLRMAGLDAAIWWEPKSYEMTIVDRGDTEKMTTLADIWDHNLQNTQELIWNGNRLPKKDSDSIKHRRLDDEYNLFHDDDDIHDDDHFRYDDFDDHHMDDDYIPGEEEDMDDEPRRRPDRHGRRRHDRDDDSDSETKGDKRDELLTLVKSQVFSAPRVRYLESSARLLSLIEELTKLKDEDDSDAPGDDELPETPEQVEKAGDEEAQKTQQEAPADASLQIDPMALPMTKNQLQRRQEAIERGFNYAISARVLLDSLNSYQSYGDSDQKLADLQQLAMGVLNHGKLSALHVWQLYTAVVPELGAADSVVDAETCVAPWASTCPPKQIKRVDSDAEFDMPPQPIVDRAVDHCESVANESVQTVCASDSDVPSEVPDGYFGYYQVTPRSDDDLISKVFAGLGMEDASPERQELLSLQEAGEKLETAKDELERKISSTVDTVGGKDGPTTLGRDGELFHLKDQCFSYDAGKYTYEICLFKGAKQKEGGSGGTNLGQWTGSATEEDDDEGGPIRVWNWDKGTKCWNGPQRSAAAMVTCGAETKMLSADEPETCRYVFEVESPVACDDEFRARHNL